MGKVLSSDYEKEVLRQTLEHERGTWRDGLRRRFAPWFDQVALGFRCHDGWSGIIIELTEEIARIVGGPEGAPELRVVVVKEKLGGLRYYVWHVPEKHALAVAKAKQWAEERSFEICEGLRQAGKVGEKRRLRAHRLPGARGSAELPGRLIAPVSFTYTLSKSARLQRQRKRQGVDAFTCESDLSGRHPHNGTAVELTILFCGRERPSSTSGDKSEDEINRKLDQQVRLREVAPVTRARTGCLHKHCA